MKYIWIFLYLLFTVYNIWVSIIFITIISVIRITQQKNKYKNINKKVCKKVNGNNITILVLNQVNHEYGYDLSFKENYKEGDLIQMRSNSESIHIKSTHQHHFMIVLIAFLFLKITIFKTFHFKEDEDMNWKKIYNDTSRYVDTVEYTEIVTM